MGNEIFVEAFTTIYVFGHWSDNGIIELNMDIYKLTIYNQKFSFFKTNEYASFFKKQTEQ